MSGIYIPGMEMPKNCKQCFYRAGGCKSNKHSNGRPQDCPLVEIPPHGDLVDKQRMAETNEQHYKVFEREPEADYARKVVLRMLDQAPTIIPAELSKEKT